jgi:ferric-dicitrate binding protein FerR (iron transport regulator)
LENNHPGKELFIKYLNNQCTPQEVQDLLHYFNASENETGVRALITDQLAKTGEEDINGNPRWQQHLSAAYTAITHHIHSVQPPVAKKSVIGRIRYKPMFRIAALFIIIILSATVFYLTLRPRITTVPQVPDQSSYAKYLILPDGSKVIVHANSKVEYPRQFAGNTRQVTLTGEAYFDIKHNTEKPFIIHTGKLKTTVLGTAFNIKAYPNSTDITVTVTRGRVKVEDDKKVLGILTHDKQLVYNLPQATVQKQAVVATEAVKWTKENMVFESVAFETITAQISRRYGITIRFTNEDIKKCPVTASFSGTESLEEVISFLCLARNATYTTEKDNTITIDGKGCSE